MKCTGNSDQTCGGGMANSVYRIQLSKYQLEFNKNIVDLIKSLPH